MRTIKAIEEIKIATDGIGFDIQIIAAGDTGKVNDKLAKDFIAEGLAEAVEQKKVDTAPENKSLGNAPDTKKKKAAKKKG